MLTTAMAQGEDESRLSRFSLSSDCHLIQISILGDVALAAGYLLL
jgi:hypothetical protein